MELQQLSHQDNAMWKSHMNIVSVENITCWHQSLFNVICSTSTILNFTKCPLNLFATMLPIIHHCITCPSNHHAHPIHMTLSQEPRYDRRPVTDNHVGRCANMMGSSGM